jgi:hypothetical protein
LLFASLERNFSVYQTQFKRKNLKNVRTNCGRCPSHRGASFTQEGSKARKHQAEKTKGAFISSSNLRDGDQCHQEIPRRLIQS